MIKGAQKQLIVLRTQNSRYFDEAYFVVRKEIKTKNSNTGDMLREATRILEESELSPPSVSKKKGKGWFFFLLGIFLGAITAAAVCILLLGL